MGSSIAVLGEPRLSATDEVLLDLLRQAGIDPGKLGRQEVFQEAMGVVGGSRTGTWKEGLRRRLQELHSLPKTRRAVLALAAAHDLPVAA